MGWPRALSRPGSAFEESTRRLDKSPWPRPITRVEWSPVQSRPVPSSRVQSRPVPSSPVQSRPVPSSPVQSSKSPARVAYRHDGRNTEASKQLWKASKQASRGNAHNTPPSTATHPASPLLSRLISPRVHLPPLPLPGKSQPVPLEATSRVLTPLACQYQPIPVSSIQVLAIFFGLALSRCRYTFGLALECLVLSCPPFGAALSSLDFPNFICSAILPPFFPLSLTRQLQSSPVQSSPLHSTSLHSASVACWRCTVSLPSRRNSAVLASERDGLESPERRTRPLSTPPPPPSSPPSFFSRSVEHKAAGADVQASPATGLTSPQSMMMVECFPYLGAASAPCTFSVLRREARAESMETRGRGLFPPAVKLEMAESHS